MKKRAGPQAYKLPGYMMRLPSHPLIQTGGAPFFLSLQASSVGGEERDSVSLQTIAIFEIGERTKCSLPESSPFWSSF